MSSEIVESPKQEKGSSPIDVLHHAHFEYSDNTPQSEAMMIAQNMLPDEFTVVEKRLKRKLDVRLMSTIFFIYVLNYLDRVSSVLILEADYSPDTRSRTTLLQLKQLELKLLYV